MTRPPTLTPAQFGALTSGSDHIWGLGRIARAIGRSEDTVRRCARHPEIPIFQPAGTEGCRASRAELAAWLRTKRP